MSIIGETFISLYMYLISTLPAVLYDAGIASDQSHPHQLVTQLHEVIIRIDKAVVRVPHHRVLVVVDCRVHQNPIPAAGPNAHFSVGANREAGRVTGQRQINRLLRNP